MLYEIQMALLDFAGNGLKQRILWWKWLYTNDYIQMTIYKWLYDYMTIHKWLYDYTHMTIWLYTNDYIHNTAKKPLLPLLILHNSAPAPGKFFFAAPKILFNQAILCKLDRWFATLIVLVLVFTYIRAIIIWSSILKYLSTNTEIGDLDWRFYQCAKQNFIKK